jgi:hypothetical protein
MLDGRGKGVGHPQAAVDLCVTHVTHPVMHLKERERINIIALGIYCPTLRGVILTLVSTHASSMQTRCTLSFTRTDVLQVYYTKENLSVANGVIMYEDSSGEVALFVGFLSHLYMDCHSSVVWKQTTIAGECHVDVVLYVGVDPCTNIRAAPTRKERCELDIYVSAVLFLTGWGNQLPTTQNLDRLAVRNGSVLAAICGSGHIVV